MPICSVWYMLLEICMPWTHSEMLCKQAISQACTLAINPSCVPLVLSHSQPCDTLVN